MTLDTSKVLIVGLGEIGSANAEYFTSIGIKPYGTDVNPLTVNRARANKIIQDTDIDFGDVDIFVVCVGTHNPNNMDEVFADPLFNVVRKIADRGKKDCLVSIESTTPLGVCNKLGLMLSPRDLVAAPHRYYKYEADIHGVNQKRTIGAVDKDAMSRGLWFYQDVLKIPMRPASSMDLAMFSKLVENSDRHLKISYSQFIKLACRELGLPFEELRTIVNDKWNTGMLEARDGISGHCLPKDSQMLVDALDQAGFPYANLIKFSKMQNEEYKKLVKYNRVEIESPLKEP